MDRQAAGWGSPRRTKTPSLQTTVRGPRGELVLGDVIKALDGSTVESVAQLLERLDAKRVGDAVEVELQRGDQRLRVTITLAERVLGSGTE